MSFRTDRREREKSKNYIFGFLNRRRAPHVEMTMGGVNEVPHNIQSCGSGEFSLRECGAMHYSLFLQ